jgi:LacI family transcriptional regulator
MTRSDRPTAACCWNDTSAYWLIGACADAGVSVPKDLAIVGFDGLLETRLPARKLVTVAVPWERIATEAVRAVIAMRDGRDVAPISVFPVKLTEGDTA